FPHVTGSVLREGRVEVTFDRLVRTATAKRSLSVVDAGGAEVPGTWAAVGATTGDGDLALQRGLRFTPATAPAPGTRLAVTVDGVADYSGRLMAEPYAVTLTAPPPPGGGGPTGPPPGPKVPDAPAGVAAVAAERAATVAWTEPADNGAELVDYVVTVLPGGRQVVVGAEQTSVRVDGLAPGTAYTFTVTARNQVGTGPASAASNQVVPTAVAPDTELTAGPTGVTLSRGAALAWAPTGASYDCELDGRPRPCAGTRLALEGLAAGTHTFSVAARDADGDVDATPATRTWTVPRDDRTLGGAGWRRRDDGRAFLGTYSQSSRRGAALSGRVRGATELAVVVTTGPRSGRLDVYLDGDRLRSISLAAGTVRHRQVVPVASFDTARSGAVRVVVASRRGAVRVDGLAVTTAGGGPGDS
ncbi:MAG TPA: fibronectin type III domain-containing protein, partial [Nocardioides sp.]|nr:fibronectin type III domain-containing protein [Nocardioides sp.]